MAAKGGAPAVKPEEKNNVEFSKAAAGWVVLFAVLLALVVLLFVYFQGGISHAIPK